MIKLHHVSGRFETAVLLCEWLWKESVGGLWIIHLWCVTRAESAGWWAVSHSPRLSDVAVCPATRDPCRPAHVQTETRTHAHLCVLYTDESASCICCHGNSWTMFWGHQGLREQRFRNREVGKMTTCRDSGIFAVTTGWMITLVFPGSLVNHRHLGLDHEISLNSDFSLEKW